MISYVRVVSKITEIIDACRLWKPGWFDGWRLILYELVILMLLRINTTGNWISSSDEITTPLSTFETRILQNLLTSVWLKRSIEWSLKKLLIFARAIWGAKSLSKLILVKMKLYYVILTVLHIAPFAQHPVLSDHLMNCNITYLFLGSCKASWESSPLIDSHRSRIIWIVIMVYGSKLIITISPLSLMHILRLLMRSW